MRHFSSAAIAALSILFPFVMYGQADAQAQVLSITNYRLVSEHPKTGTKWDFTYTAQLVNNGPALASVTATLTSLNPTSFTVEPNLNTLTFGPVPANSVVSTTGTFTILVDRTVPFDNSFGQLSWTFQTSTGQPPVANAGPNQTVKVGSTVTLNGSGSTNPSGIGTLTYNWAFTSVPSGSSAVLMNPTSVMPTFIVDVAGTYVVSLTVSNGQATSAPASVTISTGPVKPTANAGPNQTVTIGTTVHLNGSGSSDPNGNPLTYSWSFSSVPSGSAAVLTGANTVTPTFVADKVGNYVVQLIVNNGFQNSDPAFVTITDQDVKPVANAGPSQSVKVGSTVQLDGSKSTDSNGAPLTYMWSLTTVPAGSKAVLSNPNIVNPTFVADVQGNYVAQLIVNDGVLSSDPSTVTISTSTVLAPTANAGPNQTVSYNSLVQLNGSASSDPQGYPLTYQWSLISKPANSNATLSSTTIVNPTFIADQTGTYVVQLIVNNGFLNSAPSTVMISTTCVAPTANSGPSQTVTVGATVQLNGSASSDPCHDTLTYQWSLLTKPANSTATLSSTTSVNPTFTTDIAGDYVVQLVVNNGFQPSAPATVTVHALPPTTIALTPNPLTVATNGSGILTVTVSSASSSGQVINLSSSNIGVATVPATVTIQPNQTSANVPVTPVAIGSTTITASATGLTSGAATVNVVAPLSITTTSLPNGVQNSAYSATVAATGGTGSYSWSATGLPANLTINPSSGVISGTPTVSGTFNNVVVTVTDQSTPQQSVSKTFSLTIASALQITTSSLPNGVQNSPYNTTVTATGGTGNYSWSATGLPANLTIDPASGAITGTPTTSGTFNNVVVTVTDQSTPQQSASKTFSLTVASGLQITTSSLPNGVQNSPYNTTVSATGGTGNYSWSATGLPANLTINATSGAITGTPTTSGTFNNVVVTVTDQSTPQQSVSKTFSLTIAPALQITTTSLPNGVQNSPYSATVTATGGTGNYSWSATGLPANLTINSTSGVISGTPSGSGTFNNVVVTVTDQSTPQQSASKTFSLTIAPALQITTTSLPSGTQGSAYMATMTATGGTGNYSWSATGLPANLTINAMSGAITGTPTTSGTFNNVVVTVTDQSTPQQSASKTFSLTIAPALQITTTSLPSGTQGSAYMATVTATGGTGNYSWSATGLPANLTINSTNGVISGTPSGSGTFNVSVTVMDQGTPAQTASKTYSLTIAPMQTGPQVTITPVSVGQKLQTVANISVATAPTSDLTFTLTSGDPNVLLLNGGQAGLVASTSVTIPAGSTNVNVGVIGVNVGQTTLTASNGATGSASATVTQSGFTLTGPSGSTFTVNQGASANMQVAVVQLDPNGNILSTTESLALGQSATVTFGSSSPSVGTISPSSITFQAGDTAKNVTFTAASTGSTTQMSTTLTANVPSGFFPPAGNANQVTAFVTPVSCMLPPVAVGRNLETNFASNSSDVFLSLAGTTSSNLNATVTSNDPSRFLLSTSPTGPASSQITVTVPAGSNRSADFYVVGVGSGALGSVTTGYTANAGSFGNCSNSLTLNPSGFVFSSEGGPPLLNYSIGENTSSIVLVAPAMLDSSSNYLAVQQVAPGIGTVSVKVTSSNPSVAGFGNPPSGSTTVAFSAGQNSASVTVQSGMQSGQTTLNVVAPTTPAGFTTPANDASVVITVQANTMDVCGDQNSAGPVQVGYHLETACTVSLSQPTATALTVTLTSTSSSLLLSTDPTAVGQSSITVTIPAGGTQSNIYYLQGNACPFNPNQPSLGMCQGTNSVTATYNASAPPFAVTGNVNITPSGVTLQYAPYFFMASVSGGPVMEGVFLNQLDPNSLAVGQNQPLAPLPGSTTLQIMMQSSNPNVGTVTSPTFKAGDATENYTFTPVSPGQTTISAQTPTNFLSTGSRQTVTANVSQ